MEYDNFLLPSFLEGEESTPAFNQGMRNAGCRSVVSGGTAREPGCILPVLSSSRRRGNQCAEGRRGLLETQCLIRVRGNSRGKTDQQTLIMCDKKAGHTLSSALLDTTSPVKAQGHLMGTTCKSYTL